MVHFILDAVSVLDVSSFKVNHRGTGDEQFPPDMLLALLIYCYSTGRFSSRVIEGATHCDVAVRLISGNTHPDHDTICRFRRVNGPAFRECFVKVLAMASELGHLKKLGNVSVDGTKIKAAASKHSAVSYKRANEMIEQLELEVERLEKLAEEADTSDEETGLNIPDELARRKTRLEELAKAKETIEERFEEKRKEKQAEYEEKVKRREEAGKNGKKRRGPKPKPPADKPNDKAQYNFTDPESRIMKSKGGYDQGYNAQATVDLDGSMLILGTYVTDNANDKNELARNLESVSEGIRKITAVCCDNGYFNEDEIIEVEADNGPIALVSPGREGHRVELEDLMNRGSALPAVPEDAPFPERMRARLKQPAYDELYRKRKCTVEPVFGIIKEAMGFRTFLLRGLEKVNTEWSLVTLAYNFKRLFNLSVAAGG
jgi:transposase